VTWLSWRQFRAQAVVALVALIVTAIGLVLLGLSIRHSYDADLALCKRRGGGCGPVLAEFQDKYVNLLYLLDALLLVVPGLLGTFWGAPLVARELESGTHRLVWNQSVSRRRWLAVKLLVVGAASMAAAGLFSTLLTWAASPYDRVAGDRFGGLVFGERNLVPIGYAAFAFVLGTVLGLLIRRTVPAMALTLLVFTVFQLVVPNVIRPHLVTPVTAAWPMPAETIKTLSFLGRDADISGLKIPNAWVVSTSKLLARDGRTVDQKQYQACTVGAPEVAAECLGKLDLHVRVAYQPADRYWRFQWLESLLFLALGALLAAVALAAIRRYHLNALREG
jgi:ABC-type transport system involved in multi-copper enzyme maturation permease subunit